MANSLSINKIRQNSVGFLIDIFALLVIYFIPALAHLTGIPFYLVEPMRIFVILAVIHSSKTNAYLLAFTLPLFSFAVASHPVLLKSFIISIELVLNVFIFHRLLKMKMAPYISVLISVLVSKLAYYTLKFAMIELALMESRLVSSPIYIQLILTLALAAYCFIVFKIKGKGKQA
jgi:hypothetical protein